MAKKSFLEFIKNRTAIIDGAMGTMLFKAGFSAGCPETVDEKIIADIHKKYLTSGSDIVITNTFGGNRLKLRNYGLDEKVAEINKRNAQIAVSLDIDKEYYVAGGLGPTGEFMEPFGDFTEEQFIEIFSEQAKALASAGVDLIIIETMMSIDEYRAAAKAVKSSCSLPLAACMSFNKKPNGYFTMGGNTLEQLVEAAEEIGADIVGANCSLNPADMLQLGKRLKQLTKLPICLEPNAGDPKVVDGKTVYETLPNLKEILEETIALKPAIVGGCCGTDEKYISLLKTCCK